MSKYKLPLIMGACLAFVLFYQHYYDGTEFYQSTVDNKFYKVRVDGQNEKRRADLLANLKNKLNVLVETLQNDPEYSNNAAVLRLSLNWKKGVSIKEIGKMENDAAYVINKQNMSFCLQENPENGNIVSDLNLITYVGIHELAHVMSVEIGHGSEFVQNFEFLLNYAKNLKYNDPLLNETVPLYIKLNELKTADNFCGVKLVNSMN